MAAVGTGHLLGYLAGGAISKALTQTPQVSRFWNQLTPEQQKTYARRAIVGTGYLIPMALTAQQLASSAHYANRAVLAEKEKMGKKEASVRKVYATALETLP